MFLRFLFVLVAALFWTLPVVAQGKPTPTPVISDETPAITGVYTDDTGVESDWEAAVEELQSLGLVEGEGDLLFTSEMATESLGGAGSAESTYANYIMGALISVRTAPAGTAGGCTFITRGITDRRGQPEQAVGIIITSEDEIFALEWSAGETTPRLLQVDYPAEGDSTFYNPQYVVVLVNEDTLTVWINGEVYIDAWALENALPAGETYADDVTTTVNPEPGCVMTGLWGYGF